MKALCVNCDGDDVNREISAHVYGMSGTRMKYDGSMRRKRSDEAMAAQYYMTSAAAMAVSKPTVIIKVASCIADRRMGDIWPAYWANFVARQASPAGGKLVIRRTYLAGVSIDELVVGCLYIRNGVSKQAIVLLPL